MTKKTNDVNKNLTKYLPWLLLLPITLLIVFCFMFFSDFPVYLGTEQSWLNTASIVNGFVTPILTFATIILLWLTWNTSKKELQETREQLSFQSSRDTLLIILDDLLVTLNSDASPTSSQIESCAEWKIKIGFSANETANLKRLANIDFQDCYLGEMANVIKNSFEDKGERPLQNMVKHYITFRNFESLSQTDIDNGIYGYLIYTQYLFSVETNKSYFESAIEGIVSIMGEISTTKKFQLLSQVIFCKLTLEVVAYFLLHLLIRCESESPCNPEKAILEGEIKVLNDIFRSTGRIDSVYN
ncbi:hypothetical protein L1D46_15680, partial [Pseudoalteromonas sp. Isolate3]|uniref:hypothetical protein n=1 Tax=Pseudoalteromonas sp. Isolate3 TaxID=2908526 RepID=UPI001EFECAC2